MRAQRCKAAIRQAIVLLSAFLLFMGCGGGGGGGETDAAGATNSGIGWIEFTVPEPYGNPVATELVSIKLGGTTFIDPGAGCPGGLGTGYSVTWLNEANGRSGAARFGLNCLTLVFAWWQVDYGSIPLVLGDNPIQVSAADAYGNVGRNRILVKRLPDTTPPEVVSTSPAALAANVPINTTVTASFSEAMDPGSINTASFTLKSANGEPVSGTVFYDSLNQAGGFKPFSGLAYETTYTATLTTGARDLAGGHPLPQDVSWSFTTGPHPDATPPQVVATAPAGGSICAPVAGPILVEFDEEMDAASIHAATFLVTGPGDLSVPGTVTSSGKTATFTPATGLGYSTAYVATVTTGAKDLAGNPLSGDHTWNFVTVEANGTGAWSPTAVEGAPLARANHVSVWTGSHLIVAGGYAWDPEWGTFGYTSTGGRYDPLLDSWQPIAAGAPAVRDAAAVWTGTEMIVWGGRTFGDTGFGSGTRYLPAADAWETLTASGAPAGRYGHTTVWTGTEMIVWGGQSRGQSLESGGRYDPVHGTWRTVSTAGAPAARYGHTAVWTGTEMIIWGGVDGGGVLRRDGGRYDPATDTWRPLSPLGAPLERYGHTAVWTGSEMIVWGSQFGSTASGGRYHPATDTWRPTSVDCAPAGREQHTAVWTGSEMIVWGGMNFNARLGDGAAYTPESDSWAPIATLNGPAPRAVHTAIWSGSEMLVWGGYDGSYLASGGRFVPAAP